MTVTLAERLAALPPAERQQLLDGMTDQQAQALLHDWEGVWARPNQQQPDGTWWTFWLCLTGRGWGKTRVGAEATHRAARHVGHIILVAQDPADARDVMVEGESGLLQCAPPGFKPRYEPSKKRLTWPNGAVGGIYSGADPEALRGPQSEWFWADELAAWTYLQETWDNLMFGFRLGAHPQGIVTTTPKPKKVILDLLARERTPERPAGDVWVSRGSSYENRANLAPTYYANVIAPFEGTSKGRQEIHGDVLTEAPGALWKRALFAWDGFRTPAPPDLDRVVVAIDPAVSHGPDSAETGIVAAGRKGDHAWILGDWSGRHTPAGWGYKAIELYDMVSGDRIVGESNNGGELVESNLRSIDSRIPYKAVHASRGKRPRAEPVASLYERHRVHHPEPLPELEDQMCGWEPDEDDKSPDRLDAMVWALTELMLDRKDRKLRVLV